MKITLGELREMVRKSLAGSLPEESYNEELMDDPDFKSDSVYVPNSVKKKIRSWAKDMKLSTK